MNKLALSASQFRDVCDSTRDAINSLAGCRWNEIPNEARILRGALARLLGAELGRRNQALLDRRAQLEVRAGVVLRQREAEAAGEQRAARYDAHVIDHALASIRAPRRVHI